MGDDVRNDSNVIPLRPADFAELRRLRKRTIAKFRPIFYRVQVEGDWVPLGALIRHLREGRAIKPLAAQVGLSDSRWGQIERGDPTPAENVWRMARAMGVTEVSTIRKLFEAAGFEDVYQGLTRIGAVGRPDIPTSAEAGVLADPTLGPEDRAAVLEFIEARKALAHARDQRERDVGQSEG